MSTQLPQPLTSSDVPMVRIPLRQAVVAGTCCPESNPLALKGGGGEMSGLGADFPSVPCSQNHRASELEGSCGNYTVYTPTFHSWVDEVVVPGDTLESTGCLKGMRPGSGMGA